MPKTSLPSVTRLISDFAHLTFEEHDSFYWSALTGTIFYNPVIAQTPTGLFQLLHELGHAEAGHRRFESGIELLKMEVEAWQYAKKLAQTYQLAIPEELIEKCIDSYRDWLHLRSLCPACRAVSVEVSPTRYRCFNCFQKWQVSADQHSRCYRLKLAVPA